MKKRIFAARTHFFVMQQVDCFSVLACLQICIFNRGFSQRNHLWGCTIVQQKFTEKYRTFSSLVRLYKMIQKSPFFFSNCPVGLEESDCASSETQKFAKWQKPGFCYVLRGKGWIGFRMIRGLKKNTSVGKMFSFHLYC